jgi:hypothetical protein
MANPKLPKDQVNYRTGSQSKHCGACQFFRGPNGCSAVTGTIASNGTCDLYVARRGS